MVLPAVQGSATPACTVAAPEPEAPRLAACAARPPTKRRGGTRHECDDNVVQFPKAPEWASHVDAEMVDPNVPERASVNTIDAKKLDRLIATGYLRREQRHDWRAVQMAFDNTFAAAVSDLTPEWDCRCRRFDKCSGCADADEPEQLELPFAAGGPSDA
jgi:hypothetical protein